ncbi:AAA family ATPase [Magnetococcales bacterium HHB-1]
MPVMKPQTKVRNPRKYKQLPPHLYSSRPRKNLSSVFLSAENKSAVHRLIREQNAKDLLERHNLQPISLLLFYGEPGCGETVTAEAIANTLKLPFWTVRLSNLISSYLGDTAKHLYETFSYVEENAGVLLLDEFDTIGKSRTDRSDIGEMKRIVNTLLQLLDRYNGDSIIIAATNLGSDIDSAVWRRFEEVLCFKKPTTLVQRKLIEKYLKGFQHDFNIESEKLDKLLQLKSHADIERIVHRALKDAVLSGKKSVSLEAITRAAKTEKPRDAMLYL